MCCAIPWLELLSMSISLLMLICSSLRPWLPLLSSLHCLVCLSNSRMFSNCILQVWQLYRIIITWPFCCCCFMDCFWWTSRCFFRFEYCEYDLEHSGQVCGRIPRCTISCFFRLARCENALSQLLHLNGFSPVCSIWCLTMLACWAKALSQVGHLYGFIPLCSI